MSPSRQAKKLGVKSLATVSEMTGASPQTLGNWCKNKPDLFRIVVKGCVSELPGKTMAQSQQEGEG